MTKHESICLRREANKGCWTCKFGTNFDKNLSAPYDDDDLSCYCDKLSCKVASIDTFGNMKYLRKQDSMVHCPHYEPKDRCNCKFCVHFSPYYSEPDVGWEELPSCKLHKKDCTTAELRYGCDDFEEQ